VGLSTLNHSVQYITRIGGLQAGQVVPANQRSYA
jgi:hypothetical protein